MATIPEEGRKAAHILLDTTVGFDSAAADAENEAAMNGALLALGDADAVTATIDDESDAASVDVSHLVGGAIVTIKWLVSRLSEVTGESPEEIVFQAREFLDED